MNSENATFTYSAYWKKAMSYAMYRSTVSDLLARGLTTGTHQSPEMLDYARLNDHRMDRVEKRFQMLPALQEKLDQLSEPLHWLVLSEGWCGDAAQNLPALEKIAEHSHGKIHLRVLLRDENTELMDQWLTNGGRSIPKLIQLDAAFEVTGSWGPRPAEAQAMVLAAKAAGEDHHVYAERVHKWYAHNNSADLQGEILELLKG
ncbi:MAG: thioredoxin family protein [Bacteroidota bacterium]